MQALEASVKRGIYNIGIKLNYSNFVNSNNPVFKRGGNYNNGSNAGLFNFNNNNGDSNSNNSFRPVCVIWHKIVGYIGLRIYIEYICHTSFIPSVKSVNI